MSTDTFARSCAHWSEEGRAEMERFYEIASVDYRHLAQARDWRGWLAGHAARVANRPLRLLDVACGSGKFPVALNTYAGVGEGDLASIDYALLDPSRFSIDEARAALAAPFTPSTEFEMTLQALDCRNDTFDIIWATHALYALPPAEMVVGMQRLVDACKGEGFIAHAYGDAHYLKFQRLFLSAFNRADETPYASAEDVMTALDRIGVRYEVKDIAYENGVDTDDRNVVEGYLQRCLFDDGISLAQMEAADGMGDYLADCQRGPGWHFNQHVALISIFP